MKKTITAIAIAALIFTYNTAPVFSTIQDDKAAIQRQIDEKNKQLERINLEMTSTKTNLESAQKQRLLLQREIATLQGSMKQLDLSIKADEITIQKLALEINSLSYDIEDMTKTEEKKRLSVHNVFRELQRTDGDGMFILFLKHDSLEEALGQVKSLSALKQQLVKDINELASLRERHENTLGQVSTKKSSVETHKIDLKNKKEIIEDQKLVTASILSQTKNQETLYESKLNELKRQQDLMEDEIQKMEDLLKKNFNTNLLPTKNNTVFDWPVAGGAGRLTQHFGEVSSLYRGKPHNGTDIGVPVGTPIIAAADGVVMRSDNNDRSTFSKYQYGKYVLIKHENNLATLYAHLSQYVVSSGQAVKRGQVIGYSGNTGYSTGPHLHFGAYWAPSIQFKAVPPAAGLVPIGVVVNPEDYL